MALYKNARLEAEENEENFNNEVDENVKKPIENNEDDGWQKRYGDLRRYQQEKEAAYKEEIENLKKQMQKIAAGEIRPPKSEAEIAEWEKEYPDFAQIMDARVERIVEMKVKDVKIQTNEIKKEKALIALKKAVARDNPDVDVDQLLAPGSAFHAWLDKQSAITKNAIYKSLNVEDAADVIDRYVNKVLSKKKKSGDDHFEDNSAARAVRTKSSAPVIDDDGSEYLYSESQIQKMTDREWDAHGEKVQKAMREGKVYMDITGGAR